MSLPIHVALVPFHTDVDVSDLTRVSAALSKQVERDFEPIWGIGATIDAFARLEDMPIDYWPILLVKELKAGAGAHEDRNGQPFAVVVFDEAWSLSASHELLEMLADPFGRKLTAGELLDQAIEIGEEPRRVRYLLELCDPCEAGEFSYQVNGVIVSDFYTPRYFDPLAVTGVRYSFSGRINAPRQVLQGGYISWHDPVTQHWYQLRMFPDEFSSEIPHVLDLTEINLMDEGIPSNLRMRVDRATKPPKLGQTLEKAVTPRSRAVGAEKAQGAQAKVIRGEIERVCTWRLKKSST